ncbi:hypothetical protein HGO38_00800 [Rhizobium sp. CG5]|uniref:hypothetical protein n=1 Tax=Rhizobium sp. CG5 TaxID=2726076 RepID=UPI002033370D|nr:hypothetical protein [Rhizobium sp. CG5]MCM2472018.1 hypothetical protein [Rhizobium sp. CG5]
MSKILKIALASMMSVSALGGVALAQTTPPAASSAATATTTQKAMMMTDDMLSIVVIPANTGSSSGSAIPDTVTNASPQTMKAAQDEIATNESLRMSLEAKNVQLQNVVAIQTAANGGKTVYVR